MNAQRRAIEAIRPGEVLVIEARGDTTAGTIGDILALRAQVRGAAGVVTDGAIRDSAVLAGLEIPVYHAAAHPAVLGRRHVPWETDVAVACAGATIQPGDLLVGDADGVLVLPPAIAAEVLADAREQERQEQFIAERVAAGEPIEGLFPLTEARRADYEAWLAQQAPSDPPSPPPSDPPSADHEASLAQHPPLRPQPQPEPQLDPERCDSVPVITGSVPQRSDEPGRNPHTPDAPETGDAP
jgi:regulator of RNase E activity RraA